MGIKNWFTRLRGSETGNATPMPELTLDPWGAETKPLSGLDGKPHSLLIVDDEVGVLECLEHQFRRTYSVLTARSGVEAIELLRQHDVHLILAAQWMPEMQGDAFLDQARRIQPDAMRMLFTLLGKIGEGGMGAVYEATHLILNCVIALKVLKPDYVGETEAVGRFLREIKSVGSLDHPNLVRASDAGEIDGIHFLAMEFIDGLNLSDLVLYRGSLQVADSCELIRQAATGLHTAHESGLVHRDIKPSNLMLTRSGCKKVLDYGLARLYEGTATVTELTGSGQLLGTVGYMAPEQAFAKYAVSFRTDMYGLGCTFFRLLTGFTPFSGLAYGTPLKVLLAHAQELAPPIRELRPEVPEDLAAIIESLLAKNPAERFGTAAELAFALERHSFGADLSDLATFKAPLAPSDGS